MTYDLTRVLFSIGARKFTCSDFLEALKFFGVYVDWCQRISIGKQLVQEAEQTNKKIDLNILSEMSAEFRYSERLLTSEEFNYWLNDLGFELADFESYLTRAYWSELFNEDTESQNETVSDKDFFAELYFSGSFKGLIRSWQKRLLAWFEKHDSEFPNLEKLNENYQKFEEEVLEDFDEELWLASFKKDLSIYSISCFEGDKEEVFDLIKSAQENYFDSEKVKDQAYTESFFFRDLPEAMQEGLFGVKEGAAFGPIKMNKGYVLCRLESCTSPTIDDDEVLEELHTLFRDEVWRTLEVKYVS